MHWYRYEFQAHGSIHCHGVAKLKSDPGLRNLNDKALKGFLAEKSFIESADPSLLSCITEGKNLSVCRLFNVNMQSLLP